MNRKLSLLGLCFNLGFVFGYPTQAKLEEFFASQGDKVKVTYQTIGGMRFPKELILRDDEARKGWNKARDMFASESAETPEGDVAFLSYFQKTTEEERCKCFLKYSRGLKDDELALMDKLADEWGVKDLRFVDFDSIVDGLDDETQKGEAWRLIQKENEAELIKAIDEWIKGREIRDTNYLRVFDPDAKKGINGLEYKLNPEIIKTFKDFLKTTLMGMMRYKATRETLVLSLVLLKNLKLVINFNPGYNGNILHFYIIKYENVSIFCLYHELNHLIHKHLGIEAPQLSGFDVPNSKLECDLLRISKKELFTDVEPIQVPGRLYFNCFDYFFDYGMPEFVKISQPELFLKLQIFLLWTSPEEIWNIIGFSNVGGCIYVDRISDMNLLQIPRMFHGREQKFADHEIFKSIKDSDTYSRIFSPFLDEMEKKFTERISDLCPTLEAWAVWLKLQGREDTDRFFTVQAKTQEELEEEFKIISLIGEGS